MKVIKRDGRTEELDFSKLQRVIRFACEGFDGYDPVVLEQAMLPYFRNGITSREIQDTLIRVAVEKTSAQEPQWQYIAARLLLWDLYKEAALVRGSRHFGYGDFATWVPRMVEMGFYTEDLITAYSPDDLERLGTYLAAHADRDLLFTYVGLDLLANRYLVRGHQGEVLELPQECFMGVAMTLALPEQDRVQWAMEIYDVLSQLKATMATPTLAHARRAGPQNLSSCFIGTVSDSLDSIYHENTNFARISQMGGGMGVYFGKVRAKGSSIQHYPGKSRGVVPWIKMFNQTAVSVDQLGVRSGAVSITLDVWHKDILDFLQIKLNNGDERMRAHDIFPAVSIPDEFMRRVEAREPWYLFDPHEVEQVMGFRLEDAWGELWEHRYHACINEPRLSRKEIPAIHVMREIMRSAFETGGPFLFFRDTANRWNPNQHCGMVYSSNLCTEIIQNQSVSERLNETIQGSTFTVGRHAGDFVVCNLASVNLGRVEGWEDLEHTVTVLVRATDNVIDLNTAPVPEAAITNRNYRAVGIGQHGYHQYLAERGIRWESEEHLHAANELYEHLNYFAIKASHALAQEKGAYAHFRGSEWETGQYFERRGYTSERWRALREAVSRDGMRNGYLMATAPTGATSIIAATTASIDPVYKRFFVEEKKNGLVPQTAPNLSPQTFWFYQEAHQIDQRWSIRAAAVRQRHIDQSQSFNLYIREDIDVKDFLELYLLAWKLGLKTIYYVRLQTQEEALDCVACQV